MVKCLDDQISSARLWYLPDRTEGESLRMGRGNMSGFGSAFAAAITTKLVKWCIEGKEFELTDGALERGIRSGLAVMHRLLEEAFGPCRDEKNKTWRRPEYQVTKIFSNPQGDTPAVFEVRLPNLPRVSLSKETADFASWRILESKRDRTFLDLATEVARRGVEKVFTDVPIGQFEKLTTLERSEIESYRSISNLIREFLEHPRPQRPLCLAVFGAPGSGKSFGVTQVAKSLDKAEGRIEKLDFNVSQWNGPEFLVNALHRVRDHALKGKVPLVFFDEFDSQFGLQAFGWLKYFLAPMQDGTFADGHFTHDIGKAIFIFAGGTAYTFGDFQKKATKHSAAQNAAAGSSSEQFDFKSVKLPDFVSRLRGHVNVFGLDPPFSTNLLRRALILRSNLLAKFPGLRDNSGMVRIEDGVLRAFLQVPEYFHGARSLEAILDMSHLVGKEHFDPSLLPPLHQLNMHVDGTAFMALVQHQHFLGEKLEEIAREIHELYLSHELAKKDGQGRAVQIGDRPSLRHWQDVKDVYKKSNREQAASYPTLLAAIGCGFEKKPPDSPFEFAEAEIERLAEMEHNRWMEERRIKQPDHPDLVSWKDLTEEEQEKDKRTIKAIPDILGKVGLRVVRLH